MSDDIRQAMAEQFTGTRVMHSRAKSSRYGWCGVITKVGRGRVYVMYDNNIAVDYELDALIGGKYEPYLLPEDGRRVDPELFVVMHPSGKPLLITGSESHAMMTACNSVWNKTCSRASVYKRVAVVKRREPPLEVETPEGKFVVTLRGES